MLQIKSMNGEEICQGFATENQAQIQVTSALPITLPEKTYVTYNWTCTHANGTKIWDTGLPTRRIPVPWSGAYTIQVQAQYIRQNERRPYAVFWSNKVIVNGKTCTP